jgi:uncharacterized protein YceH (UPF0502 family)
MSDSESSSGAATAALVQVTPLEARVLGCLIEKAATTPEAYPLTLNSAQLACNKSTAIRSRMQDTAPSVRRCARSKTKLARVVHGARALRYEHTRRRCAEPDHTFALRSSDCPAARPADLE